MPSSGKWSRYNLDQCWMISVSIFEGLVNRSRNCTVKIWWQENTARTIMFNAGQNRNRNFHIVMGIFKFMYQIFFKWEYGDTKYNARKCIGDVGTISIVRNCTNLFQFQCLKKWGEWKYWFYRVNFRIVKSFTPHKLTLKRGKGGQLQRTVSLLFS